jgi:hypothetical protein
MAFLIEDIRRHTLREGTKYLFDANVWLAVLDVNFSGTYTPPYVDLFNKIISKKTVKTASIVVPSLLLAEILNRYIHDIYYTEFTLRHPMNGVSKREHYKKVYRKHPDYLRDLEMACKEIRDYEPMVVLLSDNLDAFSMQKLLVNIPASLDFNDYMYVQIAKAQQLILVTGDADFSVEGIQILTTHPALLNLRKN